MPPKLLLFGMMLEKSFAPVQRNRLDTVIAARHVIPVQRHLDSLRRILVGKQQSVRVAAANNPAWPARLLLHIIQRHSRSDRAVQPLGLC